MRPISCAVIGCCLAAVLGACAFDVIHVEQYSARLESLGASKAGFEMVADVNVDIGSGYHRILKKGTKWRSVGHLPQGDVYTTSDQVLTVEASNIQEAYIVIEHRTLVGFYLPVEKTFSPLPQRMELAIKELP
jgi:methenyltetrahydromethanopterin cyclohydrolase